jgi:arginyl-tRNA synthetase
MRASLKAFGQDPEALRVILIQMVSLLREGKPIAMGKREGEFITLDEVISEVGRDATRFFYLMRRHDTPLEFDLELAKRQSMDNPVYYVQYAYARCRAILRRAAELETPPAALDPDLTALLRLPEEIGILRRLVDFPDFVADAAAAHEPHRLTTFLMDLAGEFQSYYTRLQKVYGDTILPQERHRSAEGDWRARWDWRKTAARLHWVQAISQVMHNGLGILGVSAPESMARVENPAASRDNLTKEDET